MFFFSYAGEADCVLLGCHTISHNNSVDWGKELVCTWINNVHTTSCRAMRAHTEHWNSQLLSFPFLSFCSVPFYFLLFQRQIHCTGKIFHWSLYKRTFTPESLYSTSFQLHNCLTPNRDREALENFPTFWQTWGSFTDDKWRRQALFRIQH